MPSNEHVPFGVISADELSRIVFRVMQDLNGPNSLLHQKRYNMLHNGQIPLPPELQNSTKILRVGGKRIHWLLSSIEAYDVWIDPGVREMLEKIVTTTRPKKVSFVKIFPLDIGHSFGTFDHFLATLDQHPMYDQCSNEDMLYLWLDSLLNGTRIDAGIATKLSLGSKGSDEYIFSFFETSVSEGVKHQISINHNVITFETLSRNWYVRLK
jgi:hypothetical protein